MPDSPRKLMHDWMTSPAYGPGLQFERIAINQGALCSECKACGRRRSALTAENCRHIRLGNKTLVKSMKSKCQRHGCGSTDVRLYNAARMDEAQMFMAGDTMPDGREAVGRLSTSRTTSCRPRGSWCE